MMKKLLLPALSIVWLFFLTLPASAALQALDNAELDRVTGYAGISFAVKDVHIFQNIGEYRYSATDGGYLSLSNVISDVMKYNYGPEMRAGIIEMDVGIKSIASEDDWDLATAPSSIQKGMLAVGSAYWEQDISYYADGFIFSDDTFAYNLGEISLGSIKKPSWQYYLAPHDASGIDFEYDLEMHIDQFAYTYQPATSSSFGVSGIHIGNSFGADDPRFPTLWNPAAIGEFKIGDMFGDVAANEHSRPAKIDVGVRRFETGGDLLGSTRFSLPMSGSIRFESAAIGGTDFGPGAIDGIKAYRMDVYLVP